MKTISTLLLATALITNATQIQRQVTYNYDRQIENFNTTYTYEDEVGNTNITKRVAQIQRVYETITEGTTFETFKYVDMKTQANQENVSGYSVYLFARNNTTTNKTVTVKFLGLENLINEGVVLWNIAKTPNTLPTIDADCENIINTFLYSTNTTDLNTAIQNQRAENTQTLTDLASIVYRYSEGSNNNNAEQNKLNEKLSYTIGQNTYYTLQPNGYIVIRYSVSYYGNGSGYTIPLMSTNLIEDTPLGITVSWVDTIQTTTTTEIVDIPSIMFSILGMPFAWISMAFDLTIFPGTPYAVNISHIFFALIGTLILIYILKKLIK